MRRASLAMLSFLVAGCQFDPSGAPVEEQPPGAGGPSDAALVDSSIPDAALPDAALPDAALPDAMPADAMPADATPADAGSEPDARPAPCGSAGEYVEWPDNGQFYRPVTSTSSWVDARTTCTDDGAYLVVIDDQAENDHVRSLIANDSLWIGLNDRDEEDDFEWANGDEFDDDSDFSNWNDGEPNNFFLGEDCVEMQGDGGWNDESCGSNRRFVCECDADAGQI